MDSVIVPIIAITVIVTLFLIVVFVLCLGLCIMAKDN